MGGNQTVQKAAPLGQEGAKGYAGEAYQQSQQDRGRNVDAVDQEVGGHGSYGVLHANEPALESEERKGGGCGPDADVEILGGQPLHLRAALQEEEGQLNNHPLQGNKAEAGNQRNAQGPAQDRTSVVPSAIGLRGEAARTNPQEPEVPVQQVKEHGPDGDAANESGGRSPLQMPRHGHIHHSHQRDGDIGKNAGNGQPQYLAVQVHRNFLSSSSMPRYEL